MKEGIFAHWPNRITAIRFVGSIVLFVLLSRWASGPLEEIRGVLCATFWLFLLVAATDFLDGYLARRDNQVTAFGRIADPFVDKVLVIGVMVFLAVLDWSREWFPAWFVVTVLAREFLVTAIRGYVESLGLSFGADWLGKVKMVVQCIAISIVLFMFSFPFPAGVMRFLGQAGHVFVWMTLIATVGSGLSYVFKTKRLLAGLPDED